MEPVWKLRANASLELATFLDRRDCRLPRTVRLLEGYCGTNEEDALEADQILVLYKVERQKIIVGLDRLGQEICLQQNSKNKVHLLPLECHEYRTVKQLLTAKSSHFLVLDDIQCSIQIVSGSKLILTSRQRRIPNLFKCQVTAQVLDHNGSREVLLPMHLTGRFLPLLDVKDYRVEDVLAKNELPVNILFTSKSEQATTDHLSHLNAHSVTRQGNIRLTRKTDVEMVYAALFDKEFSLYIFPKTLGVNVGCSFKVSAETSKNIEECMRLKKLDDSIKDSFYFKANPVRRFNLRWPIIPAMSLPWCSHPRAKQFQTPEKESTENRVLAKRDRLSSFHIRCSFLSSKKPISGEIQEEGDYENRETGNMPAICTSRSMEYINAFPSTSEATDEGVYTNDDIVINAMKIPLRPPKTRPLSTAEDEATNVRPHSPTRPVQKPRKRSKLVAKAGSQENKANKCASQVPQMKVEEGNAAKGDGTDSAQRQTALCEDEVDEACLELPTRPIFLLGAQNSSEELERLSSQEDKPPSLPPKKQKSKVSCSLRGDTESKEENQSQCLFYSAVDVADWKKVEENYELQVDAKDHGHIFREGDTANMVIDVVCELNKREDNQLLKGNKAEERGRQQHPRMCPKPVDKESTDDENAYEEIEDFLETSKREFLMKKKDEKNILAVQTPSRTSRCACSKSSIECSTQTSQVSWHPSRNNDISISSRRGGDLVHFKDVQQFLRLRIKKRLANKLAEVEDL